MNRDQRLLEEAYQRIHEGTREPLYFGPPKRKQEFLNWLKTLKHKVHSDGSVSVEQSIDLSSRNLVRIPFNFKKVAGYFTCGNNALTTLEGAPELVQSGFYCYRNKLTSLKGSPIVERGNFECTRNDLVSLEGAPKIIEGRFECDYNKLESLKGAPEKVGRDFYCPNNNLTSLEGAPEVIKGKFINDQFSDEDYRTFIKKREFVNKNLSKDFDVSALEDFS